MIGLSISVLAKDDQQVKKLNRPKRRGPYTSMSKLLADFEKAHGDRYDYSKVVLVTTTEPVIIICSKHGPFEQTPEIHARGHNCTTCSPPGFQTGRRRKKSKAMRVKEK